MVSRIVKPPDFNKSPWNLIKTRWIYLDAQNNKAVYLDEKPKATLLIYIGKSKFYESLDGLAVGKAVSFFNGMDIIKSWGLKDSGQDHSIFSIYYENSWHTFIRDEGYSYKLYLRGQDRVRIFIARGSEKIADFLLMNKF